MEAISSTTLTLETATMTVPIVPSAMISSLAANGFSLGSNPTVLAQEVDVITRAGIAFPTAAAEIPAFLLNLQNHTDVQAALLSVQGIGQTSATSTDNEAVMTSSYASLTETATAATPFESLNGVLQSTDTAAPALTQLLLYSLFAGIVAMTIAFFIIARLRRKKKTPAMRTRVCNLLASLVFLAACCVGMIEAWRFVLPPQLISRPWIVTQILLPLSTLLVQLSLLLHAWKLSHHSSMSLGGRLLMLLPIPALMMARLVIYVLSLTLSVADDNFILKYTGLAIEMATNISISAVLFRAASTRRLSKIIPQSFLIPTLMSIAAFVTFYLDQYDGTYVQAASALAAVLGVHLVSSRTPRRMSKIGKIETSESKTGFVTVESSPRTVQQSTQQSKSVEPSNASIAEMEMHRGTPGGPQDYLDLYGSLGLQEPARDPPHQERDEEDDDEDDDGDDDDDEEPQEPGLKSIRGYDWIEGDSV